ncbi:MAG: periplasmic protein TonB [Pyrinomonadaceae bacterium]|jgi:protein TonB|nr:periplasmic protein TonB [Pyrinomonadaceae bacterium]
MKRIFTLIVILVAAAGAPTADAFAQSRRVVRRADPPKDERAEKSEQQDEKKDDSKDGAKDESKDKARDEKKGDGDEPLTGKEVAVRAVIKSKPNPGYPRGARDYGVRGVVKLRIILGADGRVRDEMEVLEGLPYGVTEEAIKAARRIEFEPARKDGRPVSQYVIVIYHFNLY